MNEIQELEKSIFPIVEETKNLVVSAQTYPYAAELQIAIRQKRNQVQAFFKPMKDKAFAAHREICNHETKVLEPLKLADGYINPKIGQYLDEQERIRKAKEAELQAEAQKRAEEEALAKAEAAEKSGDHETANAIIESEAVAAPVIVESAVPKVMGISQRKNWKWRLKDPRKVNVDFLIPDEKKIGGIVRSMGKNAERLVGGIEVWQETITPIRTKSKSE